MTDISAIESGIWRIRTTQIHPLYDLDLDEITTSMGSQAVTMSKAYLETRYSFVYVRKTDVRQGRRKALACAGRADETFARKVWMQVLTPNIIVSYSNERGLR